jgi:hypothetical protein
MRLTLPGSRIDLGLAALLAVFATGWIFAISLAAADGGLPATARGLTLSPLSPRLLDKLELTIQELEAVGVTVTNVGVVSGFRTPHYNMRGGDPRGRGALSRHMYGDAADIFIDNDRDGQMDDLNGDGRVDLSDARMIAEAAERVERRFPHLIGGIGVYRPRPGAHSGFVHIDTRGYRARW